jgi:hypothetical protein
LSALRVQKDASPEIVECSSSAALFTNFTLKFCTIEVNIGHVFCVLKALSINVQTVAVIAFEAFTSQRIGSLARGIHLSAFSSLSKERSR